LPSGLVDLERLASTIGPAPARLGMAVNNEIGTIQPLAKIALCAGRRAPLFHCDAPQGVGKIALDSRRWGSTSCRSPATSLYGPKGIGSLYVGGAAVRLEGEIDAVGQERGFRSGTLPVPLIVGSARPARSPGREMGEEAARCWLAATPARRAPCRPAGDALNAMASGASPATSTSPSPASTRGAARALRCGRGLDRSAARRPASEPSYVLQALASTPWRAPRCASASAGSQRNPTSTSRRTP